VDLTFSNTRLEQLCMRFAALRGQLGDRGAKAVAAHVASLRAAACLEDFRYLPGRCEELDGRLALRLPEGRQLVFEPTDNLPASDDDGGLDWTAIRSVRILAITRR
jgi:hypothetical protein